MRMPSDILAPALIILGLFSVWIFLTMSATILPGDNWNTIAEDILPLIALFSTLVIGLYTVIKITGRK